MPVEGLLLGPMRMGVGGQGSGQYSTKIEPCANAEPTLPSLSRVHLALSGSALGLKDAGTKGDRKLPKLSGNELPGNLGKVSAPPCEKYPVP